MASVLDVGQRIADAVGFTRPTTLVGNANDDARQIVELINQAGRYLASRHKWQRMMFEANFTTVAVENQGTLATIIGASQVLKAITNDTIWDRTARIQIYGPLSPQQWQADKTLSLTGPYWSYRIRQNQVIFNPVPTAGHLCYFEYSSKCWCTDSSGATFRRNVAADTDLFLVDEDLILASLEWRWLRKQGLSYAEEFADYELLVKQAIIDEKPRPVLQMDGPCGKYSAGIVVPIGSWPLT